ncbi:unnamed protein product [Caenorhabditis angaria]|uniref:Zonadhesin n=1 Tax=Caenorhabditis angaria TaxID=860376 RepID=A0A9P1N5H0_9PELO|nr:unnamed protein product [Caenorhabditis angaria]
MNDFKYDPRKVTISILIIIIISFCTPVSAESDDTIKFPSISDPKFMPKLVDSMIQFIRELKKQINIYDYVDDIDNTTIDADSGQTEPVDTTTSAETQSQPNQEETPEVLETSTKVPTTEEPEIVTTAPAETTQDSTTTQEIESSTEAAPELPVIILGNTTLAQTTIESTTLEVETTTLKLETTTEEPTTAEVENSTKTEVPTEFTTAEPETSTTEVLSESTTSQCETSTSEVPTTETSTESTTTLKTETTTEVPTSTPEPETSSSTTTANPPIPPVESEPESTTEESSTSTTEVPTTSLEPVTSTTTDIPPPLPEQAPLIEKNVHFLTTCEDSHQSEPCPGLCAALKPSKDNQKSGFLLAYFIPGIIICLFLVIIMIILIYTSILIKKLKKKREEAEKAQAKAAKKKAANAQVNEQISQKLINQEQQQIQPEKTGSKIIQADSKVVEPEIEPSASKRKLQKEKSAPNNSGPNTKSEDNTESFKPKKHLNDLKKLKDYNEKMDKMHETDWNSEKFIKRGPMVMQHLKLGEAAKQNDEIAPDIILEKVYYEPAGNEIFDIGTEIENIESSRSETKKKQKNISKKMAKKLGSRESGKSAKGDKTVTLS